MEKYLTARTIYHQVDFLVFRQLPVTYEIIVLICA